MRARIALFKAQLQISLREVVLSNKPKEMLKVSKKGEVPVLVMGDESASSIVIEESLEVMLWALAKSDPDNLLYLHDPHALPNMLKLITQFDNEFKACLNTYKCAKRYRENNITECRQACEIYIQELENRLANTSCQKPFIMSNQESLVDIALLPFIRQFAKVERQWYLKSPYPKVRLWLNRYLQSIMFTKVMAKHNVWVGMSE
jgi:glutathione S-transferase